MYTSKNLIDQLQGLFFPIICLACGENSPPDRELFCTQCEYKLSKTNFHLEKENEFTRRFWGRLKIESGAALYHFVKGGRAQGVVHNIKYKNQKNLAVLLGELYGESLSQSPLFRKVEVIVPVPLHPKKEFQRGYNQSDLFAKGLSNAMHIPWIKHALKRTKYTATQTKKSKMERLENVLNVFELKDTLNIQGKHVLLVDDVLTSGATLDVCGNKILELPNTKLSLATIAIADF